MLPFVLTHLALAGELALDAEVRELPNGLRVVLLEDHRTDTVALHLSTSVGSRDERPGEYGCAHLFEHIMFGGSANVPGTSFDTWLTEAGGQNNAWTSEDLTAYHMTFPSGALELALFLESDRMGFLDAGIDADKVANQRAVVLQERAEGHATPNGRDWDALSLLTWPPDHPYHRPVIGTVADVEGFDVAGVRAFWERHYRPRNAVLALVGHFDSEATFARVAHWFSDVPDRGAAPPRVTTAPPRTAPPVRRGLLEDDVEDRTLWMVWNTVPQGHPDDAALVLLGSVLSHGRGTRLDDRLQGGKMLAWGASAFALPYEIGGQFVAYASSDKTPLRRLEKLVLRTVKGVVDRPPTASELERARRSLHAGLLDRLEGVESRAELLAECLRLHGDPSCVEAEWARYEAVTPDDLVRVAATWLTPDATQTLSVVPRGDRGFLPRSVPVQIP